MPTTVLDFLRHGEPVGGRRYRGQRDDPLSDKGWAQMRAACRDRNDWQHVVSSPLARCAAFAQELAERRGLPLAFDVRLQEIGFGIWEGKTRDELEAADPGCVARFKAAPLAHRPPGAEELEAFQARVRAAWREWAARHAGECLLVVCHAGVIRMVVADVLGLPPENAYRLEVASAALTRVESRGEGGTAAASLLFHGCRPPGPQD